MYPRWSLQRGFTIYSASTTWLEGLNPLFLSFSLTYLVLAPQVSQLTAWSEYELKSTRSEELKTNAEWTNYEAYFYCSTLTITIVSHNYGKTHDSLFQHHHFKWISLGYSSKHVARVFPHFGPDSEICWWCWIQNKHSKFWALIISHFYYYEGGIGVWNIHTTKTGVISEKYFLFADRTSMW